VNDGQRIQLVAWSVLLAAFAVFVTLAAGLPWLGLRYVQGATVSQHADVEARSGTVALEMAGDRALLDAGAGARRLAEGAAVVTGADPDRAFARFFDGSTVTAGPNTRLTLVGMRRPRFAGGPDGRVVRLRAEPVRPDSPAQLCAGTTWGALTFDVHTPRGDVRVAPESRARLDLRPDGLRVTSLDGQVTLRGGGREVVLERDQRSEIGLSGGPTAPVPAIENLLVNGDFRLSAGGWIFDRAPAPAQVDLPDPGDARNSLSADGRHVLHFERSGSAGSPADLWFTQRLEGYPVSAASFLGISATLRVLGQSLAGGGSQGTEFPLILRLIGEGPGGEEVRWEAGFYVTDPEPDPETPAEVLPLARAPIPPVEVERGAWTTFETGNLLATGNPYAVRLPTRPVRLNRFEVKASGHDYESEIDSVGLWVKTAGCG
jgi:hypothetical protein